MKIRKEKLKSTAWGVFGCFTSHTGEEGKKGGSHE